VVPDLEAEFWEQFVEELESSCRRAIFHENLCLCLKQVFRDPFLRVLMPFAAFEE